MDKIKGSKIKIIGSIIIAVVLVIGGNWIYKNRKVHFEDEKMRQVICLELGKNKEAQDVTYRDLEKIEELRIGPIGEFETIIDVGKCKSLKELWVNVGVVTGQNSHEIYRKDIDGNRYYPVMKKEKIADAQKDLAKVLKKTSELEKFIFTNVHQSCNITDFNFLRDAKNLRELAICFANVSDFSFLESCSKLKKVDLEQSNIKTADSLLKLKHVKRFVLTGTPLAENEEELNRLREAFPEAKIIVD